MASYYKRLKADLASAASEGLITGGQAEQLYNKIYSERLFASFTAAHWISLIAGLLIAGGLSLMIAHNWAQIGAAAKMLAYLAVLAAAAEASMRFEDKPAVSIPAGILWFFMPVIGIGLYAQIFNLSGDPVKPYLVWLALTLPLAIFSRGKIYAGLTILLIFGILYFGCFNPGNMISLVKAYGQTSALPPLHRWLWPILLIPSAFALYLRNIGSTGLYRLTGSALAWLLAALVTPTALQLRTDAFVMLLIISLAAAWLILSHNENSATRLPALVWAGVVYAMTFFWHYRTHDTSYNNDSIYGIAATWLIFVAAVVLALLRPFKPFGAEGWRETGAKAGLLASMIMVFLLFDSSVTSARIIAVGANLLLVLTGVALILDGSGSSNEKEINSGVALICLIIVTRFVDIFGSLLKSGAAFVAAGAAFAVLAYFINKGRKALISAVNEP